MKKTFTFLVLASLNYCICQAQNTIALQQFSTGYTAPIDIENCGDSRLFIVQQSGQIMIADSLGNKRSNAFLDISGRVKYSGEQGLLGMAFDPDYKSNGFFYLDYINAGGNTQISRFRANPDYPNKASAGSEKFILEIDQPYSNHNGGCLKFGADGYLYIGMGDGGSGGDPNNNAQNPQSLLGKMLRINVHSGNPYSIPADNPFVDSSNYKKEIWALGLRNPFRWSFDAQNNYMVIADVGQDMWEEVDYQQLDNGGKNYGWRCYEGNHAYNTSGCNPQTFYKSPVYEYPHSSTTGDCAIIGGYVYRGKKYADLYGKYFFADYCSGIIRTLMFKGNSTVTANVVYSAGDQYAYYAFGQDKNLELYVANASNGNIYHIVDALTVGNHIATPVAASKFTVGPNPSRGNFVITYTSAKTQQASIHIQNVLGQQFYAGTKYLNAGNNNISMSVRLPVGDYYIEITDAEGKTSSQRIRIE